MIKLYDCLEGHGRETNVRFLHIDRSIVLESFLHKSICNILPQANAPDMEFHEVIFQLPDKILDDPFLHHKFD